VTRLSRQTRETIKTIAVLLLIAFLLFLYMIYPLSRVKAMWGRRDIDSYNLDLKHLPANDPSASVAAGMTADTFRVESDGKTSLAVLILAPLDRRTPRGTIALVHGERADRNAVIPLAKELTDSGFAVVAYDQRASGLSSGKYHGDGQIEAADVEAIVGHLGVRNQLVAPVIVVGWKLGADAAIFSSGDETRISGVVAIEPYLTSQRQIDAYRVEFGAWWFPLYRTIIWFWFNIRSGYGASYFDTDEIKPTRCKTVILTAESDQNSEAVQRIGRISGSNVRIGTLSGDRNKLAGAIVSLANELSGTNQK
jgi:pimeloyl-ACP methyl ester carboxylesterase